MPSRADIDACLSGLERFDIIGETLGKESNKIPEFHLDMRVSVAGNRERCVVRFPIDQSVFLSAFRNGADGSVEELFLWPCTITYTRKQCVDVRNDLRKQP
jgi:hypothetical protein